MSHQFAGARLLAQHCAELTRRGPRPEERAVLLAAWRRDLARHLAESLSGLLSGDRLDVTVSEPEQVSGAAALERIGPVAANALLRCGINAQTALVAFDFATAIALTERSFGGEGQLAAPAPDQLPRSAALLIDEIAATIAGSITRASLGDAAPPVGAALPGEVIVRSESAARLKPFAADGEAALFTLAIANRTGGEWRALLAIAADRLDRLLPAPGRAPVPATERPRRAPANPLAAPFDVIPVPLHVVLAEVELSLARLEALAPGDCLPLALGRTVPLMLGEQLVAHGSVGALEDRMAIRLTRLPTGLPEPRTPRQGVAR